MRPICVPCQRFFRIKKNDFCFIKADRVNGEVQPGNSEPEKWIPYQVWASDRFECEGCGAVILAGFGRAPIAENYQPGFVDIVTQLSADQFQVNDY